MDKHNNYGVIYLVLLLFSACNQDPASPGNGDSTPPQAVTNARVENLHGKAKIMYDLPDDNDLLYVKAVYKINNEGNKRVAKASYFRESLMVEGFGDTLATEVKLYAVDRSKNVSKPVSTTVEPLIPSIRVVYQSLKIEEGFGGINISFENPYEDDIVISVMTVDSIGEWVSADKFYTKRNRGVFSIRGYEAEKREFGIYIRDRWQNHSDTLIKKMVPLFEKQLDKTKFREIKFPESPEAYSGSYVLNNMWDDDLGSMYHTTQAQSEGAGFPLAFTFDLGVTTKLSRVRIWPRQGEWIYGHGNIKTMEIWGSTDPASDGSYDGWVKLMTVKSFKPSGLPTGQVSNEDVEYAAAGEEFVFPTTAPAIRYIRFKVIESWGSPPGSPSGFVHIAEVSFWGTGSTN